MLFYYSATTGLTIIKADCFFNPPSDKISEYSIWQNGVIYNQRPSFCTENYPQKGQGRR